jgi:hypothetical protein
VSEPYEDVLKRMSAVERLSVNITIGYAVSRGVFPTREDGMRWLYDTGSALADAKRYGTWRMAREALKQVRGRK